MDGMLLSGVDFRNADMRDITISKATLENINLSGSDMRGANLTTVYLVGVDLSGANLEGVKYDMITLPFIAASRLDGAKMSPDMQKDLKEVSSGTEIGL
jgi:uncharacterized protein YjbI with pentapeptide repeats